MLKKCATDKTTFVSNDALTVMKFKPILKSSYPNFQSLKLYRRLHLLQISFSRELDSQDLDTLDLRDSRREMRERREDAGSASKR